MIIVKDNPWNILTIICIYLGLVIAATIYAFVLPSPVCIVCSFLTGFFAQCLVNKIMRR